jgi:hypothetical protein
MEGLSGGLSLMMTLPDGLEGALSSSLSTSPEGASSSALPTGLRVASMLGLERNIRWKDFLGLPTGLTGALEPGLSAGREGSNKEDLTNSVNEGVGVVLRGGVETMFASECTTGVLCGTMDVFSRTFPSIL